MGQKWNLKHWRYVVVNWCLSFVIFTALYYWTPFGDEPWSWPKYGVSIVLYLLSGIASSIALSFLMHYWKHWNWANFLIYRPIAATMSGTILAVGFAWLFAGVVLTWDKSLVWLIITKLFVIGIAKMFALMGKEKVGTKFAKDLLEVS